MNRRQTATAPTGLTGSEFCSVVEHARKLHSDPSNHDVKIEDRPTITPVDDETGRVGYWVQAKVWVPA